MNRDIVTQSGFIEIAASKRSLTRRRLVFGVGVNDAEYMVYMKINGKQLTCPYYSTWIDIMRRGYSDIFKKKQPPYADATVCKEWHSFSSFKKWMEKQDWKGKHLDKDLLIIGNKEYSPVACVFIHRKINNLINWADKKRGDCPAGVNLDNRSNKYNAHIGINKKLIHIGTFTTSEQASEAYKTAKRKEILRQANIQTDDRIRQGLIAHAEAL